MSNSDFVKYMHVERLNHQETEGITDGVVHVFPKIDGTNASVWFNSNEFSPQGGSRNRILSLENDNAGFLQWLLKTEEASGVRNLVGSHEHLRLYGEWLVPHSLKTYREDAWKKFYVFDVLNDETGEFLSYDEYKPILDEFKIDYIPPLAIIKNPAEEDLYRLLQNSGQFLVEDGKGKGEGIVLKNYNWVNSFGRQVWSKIITNEFKEIHHREMGAPEINGSMLVEEQIVRDFLTDEFIKKEQAKVILNHQNEIDVKVAGWQSRYIPELLGRCWYEFIREEMTEILKKHKNPKINFKFLQQLVFKKVKEVLGI